VVCCLIVLISVIVQVFEHSCFCYPCLFEEVSVIHIETTLFANSKSVGCCMLPHHVKSCCFNCLLVFRCVNLLFVTS